MMELLEVGLKNDINALLGLKSGVGLSIIQNVSLLLIEIVNP